MAKNDCQKSGLAGELFVAAELLKRNYQVSITFGTAKAIDLFVYKEEIDYTFNVQVKTLRKSNCFLLNPFSVNQNHIYVFVLLNDVGEEIEYFPITGKEIIEKKTELFSKSLADGHMPAISIGKARKYKNNWGIFENLPILKEAVLNS